MSEGGRQRVSPKVKLRKVRNANAREKLGRRNYRIAESDRGEKRI